MGGGIAAILLALAGLLLMAAALRTRNRLLAPLNIPDTLRRQAAWQPLTELLLGLLFTFAGLYFARRIVAGRLSADLAYACAALITALTSFGSSQRFRHFWSEASPENTPHAALSRLRLRFCLGLWLCLAAALLGAYLLLPL